MKAKDMREKSPEDLAELQKSLKSEAFQARFKNFTNRLDDTSSLKKARRDVARVLTIQAERRNIGEAVSSQTEEVKPVAASSAKAGKPAKAAKKGSEASK